MLPVEAELIRVQFDISETLLLIFTEYSMERKKARSVQQEKSSIQKVSTYNPYCRKCGANMYTFGQMIDEYVREAPVLQFVERDWISAATVASDKVLNLLSSAYSLAKKDHKLKAKVTNCYHLLINFTLVLTAHCSVPICSDSVSV